MAWNPIGNRKSPTSAQSGISAATSGVGGAWDRAMGTTKGHKRAREGREMADQQFRETQPIMKSLDSADQQYQKRFDQDRDRYEVRRNHWLGQQFDDIKELRGQAESQAADARTTYTGTIQPRLKGAMEDAGREASGAMSLADAGDPNNKIQTAVREMYGDQAGKVQRQGMADFGVMSALGAQAAAGQFGTPMTAGQQAGIYAANQRQAGDAYASAQRRMFDLEQQGIDRGFEESDRQYQRGERARDRYRQSIADVSGAEADFQDRQRGFRDEIGGYSADRFGLGMGRAAEDYARSRERADMRRDIAYGSGERALGALGTRYGTRQQILGNRAAQESAERVGMMGMMGSGAQAGATYAAS